MTGRTSSAGLVLPPFTGGLHCGTKQIDQIGTIIAVFPPFDGGLHCGYGPFFSWLPQVTVVLPPSDGGLHCGKTLVLDQGADATGCSRHSAAGSIAVCSPARRSPAS